MHLTYKYGVQYAIHKQTHSNDYAFLFLLIHLIFEVVCVYIGNRGASASERRKNTFIQSGKRRWQKSTVNTNRENESLVSERTGEKSEKTRSRMRSSCKTNKFWCWLCINLWKLLWHTVEKCNSCRRMRKRM